jgi:hypothetical protein
MGAPKMRVTTKDFALLISAIITLTSLICLSGCSYAYPVELRGVIVSAKDGEPIPGVTVVLSPQPYSEGGRDVFPVSSGADGSFRVSFTMPDIDFSMSAKPWSLTFKKAGYHDATVDLGRFEEPKSSSPITIVVAATMREKGGG